MGITLNKRKFDEVVDKSSTASSLINGINTEDKTINAASELVKDIATSETGTSFVINKKQYLNELKRNQVQLNKYITEEEINKQRAKNQSVAEQAARSLAQIVGNEIVLGSLQGFTNIYDVAVTGIKELASRDENVNDFTSAASLALEQAQDKMKERLAIYRENPNQAFDIGDFGWWADNFVTVGSTLSLLIPTMTITKGASALGQMVRYNNLVKAGKSATAIARGMDKATALSRSIAKATGVAHPTQLAKVLDAAGGIGTNAVLQRTLENWQEAREVYKATYDDALNKLTDLYTVGKTEEEEIVKKKQREDFIKRNPDFEGKTKEEIASLIAEQSGYKTFAADYAMLLMDIPQFAGISAMWKGLPNRAVTSRLRIANQNAIKGIEGNLTSGVQKGVLTETGKRIIDGADDKFIKNNFINRIKENIKHPGNVFWNLELSEGVEEGYQAIMTEKGKEVADFIFDPNTDKRSLESYLSDATVWEQAFWGILGGLSFKAGGTALSNLHDKLIAASNKKNMSEEDFAKSQLTEAKLRELEIAGRYDTMMDLKVKLDLINEGKNPFKRTKDLKDFEVLEEGEIDAAKAAVVNNFLTKLTLDAVDNGNFDLLVDFVSSNEFNKYLKDIGIYDEVSQKFNQTLIDNMKDIREIYQQELHKGLEYEDIESPWLINMIARLSTRKRLTVKDLDSEISAVEDELDIDIAYENEAQREYYHKVLNQINNRYVEIENAFRNNQISREAFEQYQRDFNEEIDILAGELPYNIEWSDTTKRDFGDIYSKIADLTTTIINEKINNPDLYRQDNTNKPTAEQLIKLQRKLNLKWQRAKEDGAIPRLDYQWKREYERLERSMLEEVKKRYFDAKELLKNYIIQSEDVDQAVDDLMSGNFDNREIQNALDIIKIGYHDTYQWWQELLEDAQVEAVDRATRTVEESTRVVDGTVVEVTPHTTDELDKEVEDLMNGRDDSSTGEPIIPEPKPEPEIVPPAPVAPSVNNDPALDSGVIPEAPPVDGMPELSDPIPPKIDDTMPNIKVDAFQELEYIATSYILDNIKKDIGTYISDLLENVDLNRESCNKLYSDIRQNALGNVEGISEEDIAKIINNAIASFLETRKMVKDLKGLDSSKESTLIAALGGGNTLASEFGTINILPLEQRVNAIFKILTNYYESKRIDLQNPLENVDAIDIVDLFNTIIKDKPNISYLELLNIWKSLSPYISKGINGKVGNVDITIKFSSQSKTIFRGNFNTFLINKLNYEGYSKSKNLGYLSMTTEKISDESREILDKIKNGDIKSPKIYLQSNLDIYANTISVLYEAPDGSIYEIGYVSKVEKTVDEDGNTITKNIHSNGLMFRFEQNGSDVTNNFDELFTLLHLAQTGENNGYDKILELIYKLDTNDQFTDKDFDDLMSLSEIKKLYEEGKEEEHLTKGSYRRTKGGLVLSFKGIKNGIPDLGSKSKQAKEIIASIAEVLKDHEGNRNYNDIYGHFMAYSQYVLETYNAVYDAEILINNGQEINVKVFPTGDVEVNKINNPINVNETFKAEQYEEYPIFVVEDGLAKLENGEVVSSEQRFNGLVGIKLHPFYDKLTYLEKQLVKDSKSVIIEDLRKELKDIVSGYLENKQGYSFSEVANKLTKLLSGNVQNKLFSNISVIVENGYIKIQPYVNLTEQDASTADIIIAFDKYSNKEERQKAKNPSARVIEKHGVLRRKAGNRKGQFKMKYEESFADEVINDILKYLKFNLSKMTFSGEEITKEKSPYFYKEDGKVVVEIGGNKRVYNNMAHFIYSENAARTIVVRDNNGNILKNVDTARAKGVPFEIIKESKDNTIDSKRPDTLDYLFTKASKRVNKNVKVEELLKAAGVSDEVIDLMLDEIDGIAMTDSEVYLMSAEQKARHKDAYFIYNKSTKSIYINPDKFKTTESNMDVRVELIRSLIHEKFHKLLDLAENNPIKKQEAVNDLLGTYKRFKESLNENKDTNPLAAAILQSFSGFLNKYDIIDGKLYINNKKAKKEETDKFVEEWLVESLTQSALLQYNNQVEYGETDLNVLRNKPRTIFQKIISAIIKLYQNIAKSFGHNKFLIKNNTILAKQYMLLATELGNSPVIDAEQTEDTEVEQEIIVAETNKVNEEVDNITNLEEGNSPVEEESNQDTASEEVAEEEQEERLDFEENTFDFISEDPDFESSYGTISYDADSVTDSKLQGAVTNTNVNTNGSVLMNSIDEFMNRFSERDKLILANLKRKGKLNYVCQ